MWYVSGMQHISLLVQFVKTVTEKKSSTCMRPRSNDNENLNFVNILIHNHKSNSRENGNLILFMKYNSL